MQADKQVSPALIREGRTGRQGNINILVTSQDDIKAEFFQLTTQNQGDKHGKTSQLKTGEIDDLVMFLRSLPYETPPEVTPNTVPYRLKK